MAGVKPTVGENGTIHLTGGLYANAVWMQGGSSIAVSSDSQNLYLKGANTIYGTVNETVHSVLNSNGLTINNGPIGAAPGVGLSVMSGNVGIGTTNPTYKLSVNGTIRGKEVIIDSGWSDYVFQPGYRLKPLKEVAAYIKANQHLPGIPSEAEVQEQGVSVGQIESKLLPKVEELTLHMIQAEERNDRLEQENQKLQERITRLEGRGVR